MNRIVACKIVDPPDPADGTGWDTWLVEAATDALAIGTLLHVERHRLDGLSRISVEVAARADSATLYAVDIDRVIEPTRISKSASKPKQPTLFS
jgi:hypothetical protein